MFLKSNFYFISIRHKTLILRHIVQDNSKWTMTKDEQLVTWVNQRPQDWQVDGKCQVFMFGSGRHGQLSDQTTSSHAPALVNQFNQARQVY